MPLFRSIRWRLPITYASIAIFTTVVLGSILMFPLEDYYDNREREYLESNAKVIQHRIETSLIEEVPLSDIESDLNNYAFVSRTHIRLLDADKQTILESDTALESILVTRPDWIPPGNRDNTSDRNLALPRGGGFWLRNTSFGYQLSFEEPSSSEITSDQTILLPLYDHATEDLLGYLEFSEGPAFGTEIVTDVADRLQVAGGLAVLLAIVAGIVVSLHISRPVIALTEVTSQMTQGDLSARSNLQRGDELGTLAHSFNKMAQRIEETVTTLQRFVADAAHELHTPITALHTNLELAASEVEYGVSVHHIQQAQAQLTRLEMLANNLLDLTRLETEVPNATHTPVDVNMLVKHSHELYASQAEQADICLEIDIPNEPIVVQANESQLMCVVDNLLDNALKFTPTNGTVKMGVQVLEEEFRLWIKDTGIGIPEEDVSALFSRFHRGRNAANYPGNGLGLVIVKTIVEQHHGRVDIQSNESGTCFSVYLPRRSSA